jgi:ABC-type bacteriocin/lantibiotic exporter with double-glycine peptidase domain
MSKLKALKQKDSEACGPTVIKIAADYFNLPISFKKIEKFSLYKKRQGLSNLELVETLKKLNLKVKTKSTATWNDLMKYNKKDAVIIVSWMLDGYIGHFSAVERVTKDHIFLADPNVGKIIKFPKIVFLRLWFDYDDLWFPKTNKDIQLRWLAVVGK